VWSSCDAKTSYHNELFYKIKVQRVGEEPKLTPRIAYVADQGGAEADIELIHFAKVEGLPGAFRSRFLAHPDGVGAKFSPVGFPNG